MKLVHSFFNMEAQRRLSASLGDFCQNYKVKTYKDLSYSRKLIASELVYHSREHFLEEDLS
jgi:hypothetical protein